MGGSHVGYPSRPTNAPLSQRVYPQLQELKCAAPALVSALDLEAWHVPLSVLPGLPPHPSLSFSCSRLINGEVRRKNTTRTIPWRNQGKED